jgi:nitroimidazol reductase NimA-like FMN-containing flavoprotein (pyridoxamine 5'-phosphate oxidase superfamily)
MSPYEAPSADTEVPDEIRHLMTECYFAYLCTVNEANQPHITPIFFAFDDSTSLTYFLSASESTKIRNIRLNNRVSLTADIRDPVNPFNNVGVMIDGQARIEHELYTRESHSDEIFTESALRAFEMLRRKYSVLRQIEPSFGRSMSLMRRFSEVLVSVKPNKMVYWAGGGRFKRARFSG